MFFSKTNHDDNNVLLVTLTLPSLLRLAGLEPYDLEQAILTVTSNTRDSPSTPPSHGKSKRTSTKKSGAKAVGAPPAKTTTTRSSTSTVSEPVLAGQKAEAHSAGTGAGAVSAIAKDASRHGPHQRVPLMAWAEMYPHPVPPTFPPAGAGTVLHKVIAANGSRRATTVEMGEILGNLLEMPHHHWSAEQLQAIVNAVSGVAEVANVADNPIANARWTIFGSQFRERIHEDAAFMQALDPILVLVDLSAGNTRSICAPEGYRAFITSILQRAAVVNPAMDDSVTVAAAAAEAQVPQPPAQNLQRDPYAGQPAHGREYVPGLALWPSGIPPHNMVNSFTMFVCSNGTYAHMRLDAQTLATAIVVRFPTLRVYGVDFIGIPYRY